jgi:hypothetical protein
MHAAFYWVLLCAWRFGWLGVLCHHDANAQTHDGDNNNSEQHICILSILLWIA